MSGLDACHFVGLVYQAALQFTFWLFPLLGLGDYSQAHYHLSLSSEIMMMSGHSVNGVPSLDIS